jgi:SAM-dependent methyltransferase
VAIQTAGRQAQPAAARPRLRRSIELFRAFRAEQTDPDRFYGLLAADSLAQLGAFTDVRGRIVLDVGGGPGYFARAFRAAGATYRTVESNVGELAARSVPEPGSVLGTALALPFRTGAVDVCYSSNVLEHVADPWRMADEMVRVTRPGGLVFLSFTNWLSPWGGHETSPWHYLGGHRAADRYTRRAGHPPKNVFGESLYDVSVRDALTWAKSCPDATLITAFPRYHPSWSHWVVRVPGLRELVTWNLALVLRRQ